MTTRQLFGGLGAAKAQWVARGDLHLPSGLVLSFQRFAWPEGGAVALAPPSLGALPPGISKSGELLLPLARDECFWIGLSREPATARISFALAVELSNGETLDAISGTSWDADRPCSVVPGESARIPGIRRGDGQFSVFAREVSSRTHLVCVRLGLLLADEPGMTGPGASFATSPREVDLRLVDYATFASESGLPPPKALNPEAGYQGWLLP